MRTDDDPDPALSELKLNIQAFYIFLLYKRKKVLKHTKENAKAFLNVWKSGLLIPPVTNFIATGSGSRIAKSMRFHFFKNMFQSLYFPERGAVSECTGSEEPLQCHIDFF